MLEILEDFQELRFQSDQRVNRNLLQQVRETSEGQWPFAAILSCIDSRTSAELIFDQGIGDIFSIRVAGNLINDDILASLEFACRIAGAKLIFVLGHSQCGAIKGACDGVELGHLTAMLRRFDPCLEGVPQPKEPASRTSANADFVEAVARENVRRAVSTISNRSSVLGGMLATGAIGIVGGYYDVTSGGVSLL